MTLTWIPRGVSDKPRGRTAAQGTSNRSWGDPAQRRAQGLLSFQNRFADAGAVAALFNAAVLAPQAQCLIVDNRETSAPLR